MAPSHSDVSSNKSATGFEEDTDIGVDEFESYLENSVDRIQTTTTTPPPCELLSTTAATEASTLTMTELTLDSSDTIREFKTMASAETASTATSGEPGLFLFDIDGKVGNRQPLSHEAEDPEMVGAFSVRSTSNGTLEVLPATMYANTGRTCPQDNSSLLVPAADAFAVNEREEEQRLKDAEEQGRQSVLRNAVDAEVVVPQLFTKQNFQMPRFIPENEKRFRMEHNHLLMSVLPIFRPLAMSLNMAFFLWGAIQPEAPLLSCFLVIAGSLLVYYGITKIAEKNPLGKVQPVVWLAALVISLQIATLLFLVPDGFVVGVGCFGFILVPGCCALRFGYALLFCTATVCISNGMAIASHFVNSATASHELYYVLIHLNMFVGTYCLFALFLSYIAELHLRQRFRDSGTIFNWSNGTSRSFRAKDQLQESLRLLLLAFAS